TSVAIASVAIAWLATLALATAEAKHADACVGCHPAYVRAASGARHSSLTCQQCHSASGFAAPIVNGIDMQRRYVAAAGGGDASATRVDDGPCIGCHARVLRGTVTAGGIAVRHRDFAAWRCADCHGGVGHAVQGRSYRTVEMGACLGCHENAPTRLDRCEICHKDGPPKRRPTMTSAWRLTHGENWKRLHGMGELSQCKTCHEPAFCAQCHGTAIPHPATWTTEHAVGATDGQRGACLQCHEKKWCDRCHGIEMPHGAGFLRRHGSIAEERSVAVCTRCHEQAACDNCHFESSHPQLPGAERSHGGSR
ncbi:MAG: hypothetical protein HY876_03965, partial [Coriobacteriales bacterium]|nr:hypothetical protein [Coriobacteriales bacterium]